MKYILITLILLTSNSILTAQSFEELKQSTHFDSLRANSILFFDFNNDNKNDLFIISQDKYGNWLTKLYKNSNGTLIEVKDTPFDEYPFGSVVASDIDNDGDNDIFIAGIKGNKLFINTSGTFKRYNVHSIFGSSREVAISDIDNDGVVEFFANYEGYRYITNIYKYNNDESYSEIKKHPIDIGGKLRFSDIDNDGFEDLLISGYDESGKTKTKLYKNSAGTFEQVLDAPFGNVAYGSIEFSDIDNDGYEDLIVSEPIESNENGTRLYKNNSGTFEEVLNTPFEDLTEVSLAFSDLNNDGYSDLIFNGKDKSDSYITKLYLNESGTFKTVTSLGLDSIGGGSIALSDVDGDSYDDILISGQNKEGKLITKLYKNEQGEFIGQYGTPFEGLYSSSIAFSDVDVNGFVDILMLGHSNTLKGFTTRLFMNENGRFTEFTDTVFFDIEYGSAALSDIDNDGYEDLIIADGDSHSDDLTKLYKNIKGKFIKVDNPPFKEIITKEIVFSDIDNDGYNDLLITGFVIQDSNRMRTILYKNNKGEFTKVENTPFVNLVGDAAFSDIDNNGFEDLLILGTDDFNEQVAHLYKNEDGIFNEVMNTPFVGLIRASPTFIDIDNDGDKDLFITGYRSKVGRVAKLYNNEGGNFTEINDILVKDDSYYTVDFLDIDDNGFIDLLLGGYSNTLLYKNDKGVFTRDETVEFEGLRAEYGTASFLDYNNDGNFDVFITGEDKDNNRKAKLYKNLGPTSSVKFIEKEFGRNFEIYPNPTKSDKFEIKFDTEFFGSIIIEIIDINGQTINNINKTIELGQQSVSVETGNLSKGIFLVKLTSNGKEEIHKLIKQ
ncbi:MAG: hypothetical protein CVV25_09195 [Ignavibacteriae bacterium HGW-Ignavibacteriae-4]|nr:MAG: hypothetical protein CVV25_09195 [Ignavibacteriae bacterium HGW-Ignavibacteriae-4]